MIDHEALLDGLLVVVSPATLLSTEEQTFHQLIFRHVEFNHGSHLVATLVEHLLQSLCLWDRTGETVEDDTLVIAEAIIDTSEDAHHEVIGYQLSVVDIRGSGLTQLCPLLDLTAKHITRRDMIQSVLLNHLVALRTLSRARSAENHNILHRYPYLCLVYGY